MQALKQKTQMTSFLPFRRGSATRAVDDESTPKDVYTCTFKPGKLGIDLDFQTGSVREVVKGGQAEALGVKVGMRFIKIGSVNYSKDVLVAAVEGCMDYLVTLANQASPSSGASRSKFYECSEQELYCRQLLVHQEAVADLAERYASSVLRVLQDLATAHDALNCGLQQAADLVSVEWADRVVALVTPLSRHAEHAEKAMAGSLDAIGKARANHREAVRLSAESDSLAQTCERYNQKVTRLRAGVEEARTGLGPKAFDPDSGGSGLPRSNSSGSLLSKGFGQRKTNNYDMKLGQLCRNEEKLSRIEKKHQLARAHAARKIVGCVSGGRDDLRSTLQDILHNAVDVLLPGIHDILNVAKALSSERVAERRKKGSQPVLKDGQQTELGLYAVGELVTIGGLESAPQYNGMAGTVKSYRADGRVEVELALDADATTGNDATTKVLAVKPEHIARGLLERVNVAANTEFMRSGEDALEDSQNFRGEGEDSSDGG